MGLVPPNSNWNSRLPETSFQRPSITHFLPLYRTSSLRATDLAWYLDEFGSKVNVTAQLKGSELRVRPLGSRWPPAADLLRRPHRSGSFRRPPQRYSGTFSKSGRTASGEFIAGDHVYVFSGGIEGNCVKGSYGKDGKGVSIDGCVSVKIKQ